MIYNNSKRFLPIYKQEITPPGPDLTVPLTFKAINDNTYISLNKKSSPPDVTLYYSKDSVSWTRYYVGNNIKLNGNETVMFSGNNTHFANNYLNYNYFATTGYVEASGNVMSLLGFNESTDSNWFSYLFDGCSGLITPPLLPALNLTTECYRGMFRGCKSLTTVPELPALSGASSCYNSMFSGCTSLISGDAGAILSPVTAYQNYMFSNCTKLTGVCIHALTGGGASYMFFMCNNLIYVEVDYLNWGGGNSGWIQNPKAGGIFKCPTALGTQANITRGNDYCPSNWTVVNK